MAKQHFLNYFLEPESVALIGISRRTGRGTFNIMESLMNYGYKGIVYPINPNAKEILGVRCLPGVESLPMGVDLAVIITPRDLVPEIVRGCAKKGVKGIIIVTEGFNEADERGKSLQKEVDEIVKKSNTRILGPNSIGVVNAFKSFSSSFLPLSKTPVPVALVSQSGGFFEGFPNCPFGKGIDLGNTSDIDFSDAISYLKDDDDTRVIVLYTEEILGAKEFVNIARQVAREKPILVIRGGRSVSGKKAAASHTGSMGGKEALYAAMFRKAGVYQVDAIMDVGDFVKAFLHLPPFTGNRVGIITPTGGGGIISLDAIEHFGFLPSTPSREMADDLEPIFQPWITVRNPVDILSSAMTHGFKNVYQKVLEAFFRDNGTDIIFAVCGVYTLKTIKSLVTEYPHKPLVSWVVGADQSDIAEKAETADFQPYYLSPDRAMRALKGVRQYYLIRERPLEEKKEKCKSPLPHAHFLVNQSIKRKAPLLGADSLSFLEACHIPVVPTRRSSNLSDTLEAAETLGYPVVLKINDPSIIHKTERKGVVVDISKPEALESAYRKMAKTFCEVAPDRSPEMIIQPMLTGGEEIIIGLTLDPQIGHVIMYGTGGIYTEVLEDVSFRLVPITRVEAKEMIDESRFSHIYDGYRGQPPMDRDSVIECILKLSYIAEAFPAIKELDINPLMVFSSGVVAADARIIL
jgi:acetyltransferase